jgi:hypothetical protein
VITDALVGGFLSFLTGFMVLAPAWSLPTLPAISYGQTIGNYVGSINRYLPLTDMAIMFAAAIVISLALSYWHLIFFVYHQFWGSD